MRGCAGVDGAEGDVFNAGSPPSAVPTGAGGSGGKPDPEKSEKSGSGGRPCITLDSISASVAGVDDTVGSGEGETTGAGEAADSSGGAAASASVIAAQASRSESGSDGGAVD